MINPNMKGHKVADTYRTKVGVALRCECGIHMEGRTMNEVKFAHSEHQRYIFKRKNNCILTH
jgi:hypothetical protein